MSDWSRGVALLLRAARAELDKLDALDIDPCLREECKAGVDQALAAFEACGALTAQNDPSAQLGERP